MANCFTAQVESPIIVGALETDDVTGYTPSPLKKFFVLFLWKSYANDRPKFPTRPTRKRGSA